MSNIYITGKFMDNPMTVDDYQYAQKFAVVTSHLIQAISMLQNMKENELAKELQLIQNSFTENNKHKVVGLS